MNEAAVKRSRDFAETSFCGERFFVDPRGCLIWPDEKIMIVSDLHLEKGSSFAARRQVFMPPYDTKATLTILAECLYDWEPDTLISLGDSFHDEHASNRLPEEFCDTLGELMKGKNWIWVQGNHDPTPPEKLGGDFCSSLQVGQINFTHEPLQAFMAGEIAGHLHPCGKIRQRGKSVRRRCLVRDQNRMILPAFGAFTGGLNVRDQAFDGLLEAREIQAYLLSADNVFPISGKQLVK